MTNAELKNLLADLKACQEAVEWVGCRTLAEAWAGCRRADWMLWLASRMMDWKLVVRAACAAVRPALKYVTEGEDRPLKAIETAEAWVRGEATIDDVKASTGSARSAAEAAWSAAWSADAAWAAEAAAYAARAAAEAAGAAEAAASADSAAWSAEAADAARAAADAARATTHREMCDIVRSIIPDPDKAMADKEG